MTSIKVPPLGESIVEATVSRWMKKEGDQVSPGDTLVELETDKITVEVPAMSRGVLTKRLHSEGDVVDQAADGPPAPARPPAAQAPAAGATAAPAGAPPAPTHAPAAGVRETREKMSTRRKRIAEHLLESQHATAHLTTFNEIDMA